MYLSLFLESKKDLFGPKNYWTNILLTIDFHVNQINFSIPNIPVTKQNKSKASLQIKKCPKKCKKSTIFLPPLPQDVLDFFEFGKNSKFDDPPPLYLIWEKFEIGNILNFENPPSEKKNKTLKIAQKSL